LGKSYQRVDLLDYLRGIMALSVLVYHYTTWSEINLIYPFDQVVSRLGIYAVSAFYVLSGVSLAYVYFHKKVNVEFLKEFTIKRFFRIAPLVWVVTTATLVLAFISSSMPDLMTILLNYTLTFGWLSSDSYIATGAWSIGNELVFYSFFPLMLYLITKSKKNFAVFGIFSVAVSFYISEVLINNSGTLTSEWTLYINPLNQLYLFVGGFLIGYLLRRGVQVSHKILLPILAVSIVLFIFLPFSGHDRLLYVTGLNKVIFSLTIFGMSLFTAFWGNVKHNFTTNTLKYFGDISYSVYLIHPLAYTSVNVVLEFLSIDDISVKILLSVVITIITSTLVYKFIERPFVKIGREVSSGIKKKQVDVKLKEA